MWIIKRLLSSLSLRGPNAGRLLFLRRSLFISLAAPELRYLQCTCCWRSRVPVAGFETLNAALSSASKSSECSGETLDAGYSEEQRDAILRLLNTADLNELSSVKLLRGRKSANIVEYRTNNGPFTSLDSVVKVPRIKHKSAVVVFNSILNPEKRQRKTKAHPSKFTRPEVDRAWLEEASSIVSLVCGLNKIAWAHMDKQMSVLDWRQKECPNFMTGSYMASAYLTDVSSVVSLLPPADFYIVEKTSISHQNTSLFPIMSHMRTVEAMLFALLEPRGPLVDCNIPPRVLNMSRATVGRHFRLMVGESRTSSAELIRHMMRTSATYKLSRINFTQELRVKYRNYFQLSGKSEGEELSDALLQAVAFFELLRESSSPC